MKPESHPPSERRAAVNPDGPERLRVRFGPAGWSYADWQGVLHPHPRPRSYQPVRTLADLFDTIEVNVTFYRDVSWRQLVQWVDLVRERPAFRWCFKLNRRLSHRGEIPGAEVLTAAMEAFAPVREAERLGALLLQFPWSVRQTPDTRRRLEGLFEAARRSGWPLVVELRHESWGYDPPSFPPVVCDQPPLRGNWTGGETLEAALAAHPAGAGPLYIRLHGHNRQAWFDVQAGRDERYNYLYAPTERAAWIARLRTIERRLPPGAHAILIANNHFRGQALVDALLLQKLWRGVAPPLPPQLRQAYPQELGDFPLQPAAQGPPDGPPPPPSLF